MSKIKLTNQLPGILLNVSIQTVGASLAINEVLKDLDVQFDVNTTQSCKSFSLHINSTANVDPTRPILPIKININFDVIDKIDDTKQEFCETCVVLDPREMKALSARIKYKSGCNGDRCVSDLILSGALVNVTEPYVIGSTKSIVIQYEVSNSGEPAFMTQLNISIPVNITQFMKVPSICRLDKSSQDMICDLNAGKPVVKGAPIKLNITLDTAKLSGESLKVGSIVSTDSDDQNPTNNQFDIEIFLTEFSDVELTG